MSDGNSFNIFEKLREWSQELENWQQLALLRLLQKGTVDEQDIALIYEEFKIDKGLTQSPETRVSYDLNHSTIPQPIQQVQTLLLSQIKDVKGVNAIAEGQVLYCGPSLTVIYGPNGSGKSGYARILKSACFTRSPYTTIHGNVNLPAVQWQKASSTFVFSDNSSISFCQGTPCPQLRDNFAVFDTSCIRVCVDSKNDFMVNPYGFDIFQDLVDVIAKVKGLLEAEIEKRKPDITKLRINNSSSRIAVLLNSLSKVTDLPALKQLGNFGPAEEKRLTETNAQLDELIKKDPSDLIKQKRTDDHDIKAVIQKLENVKVLTLSEACVNGDKILQNIKSLREIASAASAAQFGKEPIQPVGTEAWRSLIEAAIKYNAEVFPGKPFPLDSETSRCLLCHQVLSKEAKERLSKFYNFIRSEAENNLRKGLEQIRKMERDIEGIDLGFFCPDTSGYRAIESYDAALLERIKTYIDSAKAIRDATIKNLKCEKWEGLLALSESPQSLCRDLRNKLAKEIKVLRKQDVTKQMKLLEEELQLLKDRQRLSQDLSSIEEAVLNLRWIDKAQEPKRNLNPQRVTLKQKALANELVGKGFMERFKEECETLGLNNPPLKINITGSEAVTRRNLAIGQGDVTLPFPSEVLSEGEQTAVAMADFLTEIALNKSPVGIIFDDPVNSMDHLRKEKIAKRLVVEACKRQVLIFTHDVIFTHHLAEEAVKLGVGKIQFKACTISVGSDCAPGYVDRMVFPHVYYEKEAEKLAEEYLVEAKKLTGNAHMEKLELGCGALRAAYEHFIQEQIFNDVVKRWREPIRATSLSQVYFNLEINDSIVEHYEKLSRYEKGHSHSAKFHETPLTMIVLEEEIRIFKETEKKYKQEADKYRKDKSGKKKIFS